MAIIKSVRGYTPKIGENVFLADNAAVIGNVEIGDNSSIWFGAVLRGDVNSIKIGKNVNIQDGAVLHTLYDKSPKPSTIELGDNVSVGHNATIHGAKIENNVLIGMGSIVLDNVVVVKALRPRACQCINLLTQSAVCRPGFKNQSLRSSCSHPI